jgi:protein-tyrosine phosphatase
VTDAAVTIAGLLNFRDVGGLPTRDGGRIGYRRLYRSHAPTDLGAEDRAAISALGLRAVLDLRDVEELAQWPYELDDRATERINVPVLGDLPVPEGQADLYTHMVEACAPAFTQAVRTLSRAEVHPVLVHCAVGKDRTGVVIAFALSAVGVPDEAVVADFLRSNPGLNIPEPAPGRQPGDRYQTHRYVAAGLIESALERARRIGGDVPGYLAAHGMSDAELSALRAALVERVDPVDPVDTVAPEPPTDRG